MLLSQEDLLSLKVGSVLHHLSIKRAIQVLRLNSYDPNCLRRRPSDEVSRRSPNPTFSFALNPSFLKFNYLFLSLVVQSNVTPAEISQWTNHRVMEWLRSVDLAEYAPNLRGSGVHGGLMVSIIYTKINTGDRINCGNCKLEVTKCVTETVKS